MELEADLGGDSVKQTELLSHAADHYQLPVRPTDFRLSDYSTMGGVAAFVFGALTAPAAQFGTVGISRIPAGCSSPGARHSTPSIEAAAVK